MHPFELVIFDCDGVLVDSERLIVKVEAQLCREHGWDLTEDDVIREFVGLSDDAMRARLSELIGEALPPNWDDDYADRSRTALERDLEIVPGVAEAMDAIERAGIATCVASSGSGEKMALTLGKTGLLDRFAGRIFSATDPDVARGKPAPDLFLIAAARMGFDPANCAVIEDSPFGIEAALAAGMRPFGYAGSVIPADRLAIDGTITFDSMADLPMVLAAYVGGATMSSADRCRALSDDVITSIPERRQLRWSWTRIPSPDEGNSGLCPRCHRRLPPYSGPRSFPRLGWSPGEAELISLCLVDGRRSKVAIRLDPEDLLDAAERVAAAYVAKGWTRWKKFLYSDASPVHGGDRLETLTRSLETVRRLGPRRNRVDATRASTDPLEILVA
ncbi:MAG: HAD family hydrolase, partial [Acidimicrobiia bacterium]